MDLGVKDPGACPGEEGGVGWEEQNDLRAGVCEVAGVNLGDFVEQSQHRRCEGSGCLLAAVSCWAAGARMRSKGGKEGAQSARRPEH